MSKCWAIVVCAISAAFHELLINLLPHMVTSWAFMESMC